MLLIDLGTYFSENTFPVLRTLAGWVYQSLGDFSALFAARRQHRPDSIWRTSAEVVMNDDWQLNKNNTIVSLLAMNCLTRRTSSAVCRMAVVWCDHLSACCHVCKVFSDVFQLFRWGQCSVYIVEWMLAVVINCRLIQTYAKSKGLALLGKCLTLFFSF